MVSGEKGKGKGEEGVTLGYVGSRAAICSTPGNSFQRRYPDSDALRSEDYYYKGRGKRRAVSKV